jgi:multicomponent Na+:H+ antiporter subunit F
MTLADTPWMLVVAHGLLGVIGVSMLIAAVRLFIGPTLADRVVAFDLMLIGAIASIAILGGIHRLPPLIDIAVVLGLIVFIGTVAIAWFLERSGTR